jgi:hypothetical protein
VAKKGEEAYVLLFSKSLLSKQIWQLLG